MGSNLLKGDEGLDSSDYCLEQGKFLLLGEFGIGAWDVLLEMLLE